MIPAGGRWLVVAVMAGVLPLLSACGVSPLYGEREGTAAAWRQVKVAEPRTRAGQLVRNALLAGVAPQQEGAGAYRLSFTVTEEEGEIISREDIGTARRRLTMKLDYELKDGRSGKVLTRGRTLAETSYPVTRQHFADVAAREQAQRALAQQLAQDVRERIAVWLADRGS